MANQSRLALAADIPFRDQNGGQRSQVCQDSAESSRKDDKDKKLKEYASLLLSTRKRTAAAGPADTGLPDEDDGTPAAGGDPDPLRLLSQEFLAQIDDLARSFQQNEPCPHVSINSFLAPDFCEQLVREFPDCDADVLERFRATICAEVNPKSRP